MRPTEAVLRIELPKGDLPDRDGVSDAVCADLNDLAWRERLVAFLATEGDVTVSGRTLREWIEWAKAKAEALNPFGARAVGMFQTIARVAQWS